MEARANGANSPNKFESIENLKTAISNDDNIVEDLRQRGIISNYSLYSDLKSFRDSEKVISLKYDDMWIDYSKQKIVDNIYEVPVSEIVCTRLNIRLKRANTKCLDNIVQIRLKGV